MANGGYWLAVVTVMGSKIKMVAMMLAVLPMVMNPGSPLFLILSSVFMMVKVRVSKVSILIYEEHLGDTAAFDAHRASTVGSRWIAAEGNTGIRSHWMSSAGFENEVWLLFERF